MLRILGPLELSSDGRLVELGGPRQRIVLSMLALSANRVTSVAQLIDAVWDTAPPATARSQIHICISSLRRLFNDAGAKDAILTRPPGYLLRIDDLDKLHFEDLTARGQALLEAGQTLEAAATLRSGLELWRGPALADIPSELPRRSATALDDARFSAQLGFLRAQLSLGRHGEIIGQLRDLIADRPLHEELHGLLMLALYRSARQADALAAFQAVRSALVGDIGVEPGRELQSLQQAILNQDPALNLATRKAEAMAAPGRDVVNGRPAPLLAPPIIPRQLPASLGDFTGRAREIAEIRQVVAGPRGSSAAPYAARIVAVSGAGGIGKTALAIRAGQELIEAFPDGHLYAELGMQHGSGTSEVLGRFLRALGVSGPAVPDDLQDRLELYRSKVAAKQLLVILDDVSAEAQVLPLLPAGPGCAVIMTSRSRLSGLAGAHLLELDLFPEDNALELLSRIVGVERVQAELGAATELTNLCGGLPLALRIAGARLASRPHWKISELVRRLSDEARRLDEFVYHGLELRSSIGLTYGALDERVRRLFRFIGLVQAADFPGWTAAALLDTDLGEAEECLEALVDARLLDVVVCPDERGVHYRFHDLIRAYAVEQSATDSAAERLAALSRVIGGWLTLADEAHRLQYGGDYAILHGNAARWWSTGVGSADLIGDPVDWWENERRALVAAIRQTAALGWHDACWDLALSAVTLFEARGYFDDWLATNRLARDVSRRAGNDVGTAAMLYSLGELYLAQKRLAEAKTCLAEAYELFETAGERHGAALVLCDWASVDRLQNNTESMFPKFVEALEIFHAVGDRVGEAYVQCSLAKYWIGEGEYSLAEGMLNDALVICREERCRRVEAQALHRLADVYLATDRIGLAAQVLDLVLHLVRGIGDRIGETYVRYSMGVVRHREGDPDRAQAALSRALELSKQVSEPMVEGQAHYTLAEMALAAGDTMAANGHLAVACRAFSDLGSVTWYAKARILSAETLRAQGDVGAAIHEVEEAEKLLSDSDSQEARRYLGQIAALKSTVPRMPVAAPGRRCEPGACTHSSQAASDHAAGHGRA